MILHTAYKIVINGLWINKELLSKNNKTCQIHWTFLNLSLVFERPCPRPYNPVSNKCDPGLMAICCMCMCVRMHVCVSGHYFSNCHRYLRIWYSTCCQCCYIMQYCQALLMPHNVRVSIKQTVYMVWYFSLCKLHCLFVACKELCFWILCNYLYPNLY